jgi:MFS family permease
VLFAAGVLSIAAFLMRETRVQDPILRVDLFRTNRVFAFSHIAVLINYTATFAVIFLLSLYLQFIKGLDATSASLVIVAGMFTQAVVSPVSGRLSDRAPARVVASLGMAICVLGLGMLVFLEATTPYWYAVVAVCVLGLGIGLFATPIIHAIMGSVDRSYAGVTAATTATMRATGQNISLGLATVVLAAIVGRQDIVAADYPHLMNSIRITFGILAAICVLGVPAALAGPRRRRDPPGGSSPNRS